MSPRSVAEAVAKLDAINGADPEAAHCAADDVLLYYADAEIAAAYQRVIDRCAWWAAA